MLKSVSGEGNFGKVYTAVNVDAGELIAMKEIRFAPNDHQTMKEVSEEIKMFEGLKHPSLVKYYGVEVHRVINYSLLVFCTCQRNNFICIFTLFLPKCKIF